MTAWNEKSFPAMSRVKYRHDVIGSTSGWAKAPAFAVLGAEWHSKTNLDVATPYLRRQRISRHGHDDSMLFLRRDSSWRYGGTITRVFHKKVALHSPARNFVKTWGRYDGFRVVFIALHLTQGCAGPHENNPVRCAAVMDEISWLRAHPIRRAIRHGRTVILGGDLNRNPVVVWNARQRAIRPRDLMQLAVIPGPGVAARIRVDWVVSRLNPRGLWTDHLTPRASISLRETS